MSKDIISADTTACGALNNILSKEKRSGTIKKGVRRNINIIVLAIKLTRRRTTHTHEETANGKSN